MSDPTAQSRETPLAHSDSEGIPLALVGDRMEARSMGNIPEARETPAEATTHSFGSALYPPVGEITPLRLEPAQSPACLRICLPERRLRFYSGIPETVVLRWGRLYPR